jgi:Outer membrane cobalamin receptor protein
MKKQLLILFFFLSFINAQDVEEVVVTSSLTDQTQIDNPVHVVSKEDLANDASVSLGEALDNLLGVSNADFGPAIGQPIIRGMSGSRVKVLSNGMVVRDVSTLGPDHPNNIDLSNAEQVEV